MIDLNSQLEVGIADNERDVIRQVFYENILSTAPVVPEVDLESICKAWLAVTQSEWVWLWLLHEDGKDGRPWELAMVAGKSGIILDYVPGALVTPQGGRHSVAQYVTDTKRPIFVPDITDWTREIAGKVYSVVCLEELSVRRKCTSVLVVPLLLPNRDNTDQAHLSPYSVAGRMRAVLCAHFMTPDRPQFLQGERSLLLMGRATAQALIASSTAQQQRILFHLDSLASRHLASRLLHADRARQNYLKELISYVRQYLRVQYVSIFYKDADGEKIRCIASTGIGDGSNAKLARDQLSKAWYAKGEKRTGKVFVTGIPYIGEVGGNDTPQDFKWQEIPLEAGRSERDRAWVAYPIIAPTTPESQRNSEVDTVLGVMRCIDNRSALAGDKPRNFDPVQLQTLDFISKQLAPTLEAFAVNIERESSTSIIKHDLFGPLGMIRDGMRSIASRIRDNRVPSISSVKDLQAAFVLAKNLVGSLTEQQGFDQSHTDLEKDILRTLVDALSHYAQYERGIVIEYEREDIWRHFPRMTLDRELIERAVCNLLTNAIKYGHRDTQIELEAASTDDSRLLKVSNFGIGVRTEDSEDIFEGTFRSQEAKDTAPGLGLGLKIARLAMRKHGGDVVIERLRMPTVFTLRFPRNLIVNIAERDEPLEPLRFPT